MVLNVQVRKDKTAIISCPDCKIIRTVDVSGYQNAGKLMNVRCICKTKFKIRLEFRHQHRKPTRLDGYYALDETNLNFITLERQCQGAANCCVKNISRDGVGFEKYGQQDVSAGSRIWLQFTLNNAKRSKIIREVVVKSVKRNFVGGEFVPRKCGTEPELGFYLMS